MRALILIVALLAAVPAQAATYAIVCAAPCVASDGTTQPAGTALAAIAYDGRAPYTPPPNTAVVPYAGQTIYVPATPAPSLSQQAQAMLAAGLSITSTSTPALNGTYAADAITQSNVMAEMVSLLANAAFTNGTTTLAWPDATGAPHNFTAAQFKAFATAEGQFVGVLAPVIATNAGTLPSASATIP